jgi:hypothetical protein
MDAGPGACYAWGMKALPALAVALLCAAAPAAKTAVEYEELPPGRYEIVLKGLVTTVCARAIAADWAALPEVEKVETDFARSRARVSVRLDRTLKVASLRKGLRRAERVANLGARYDLGEIRYLISR